MGLVTNAYKKSEYGFDLLDIEGPSWHVGGARAILEMLEVIPPKGDIWTSKMLTLPELRQAIMKAKAQFGRKAKLVTREPYVIYGEPREVEDGVVELRPVRCYVGGIDEDSLRRRLKNLEEFLATAEKAGAELIGWG